MLNLLAQTPTPDKADPELGYNLLAIIMAVGIAGMVLMLGLMMIRRLARRWEKSIERDIAERRANPTPTNDVWRESAERYTDPDALSPEERAAREQGIFPDHEEEPEPFPEPPAADADPSAEQGDDDDDPFGLFRDKPYQDPVDEDEDDEAAEGDEDKPF